MAWDTLCLTSFIIMQKIILCGNVGKKTEIVKFGDREKLSFSLACTTRDKVTTWYNILSNAIKLQQHITSGKQLIVIGDFVAKTSQGKDGKTYMNLNVYAESIEFVGQKQGATQAPQQAQPAPQQNTTLFGGGDDGMPF